MACSSSSAVSRRPFSSKAGNLWEEFGHEDKAGQLKELAGHYRQIWERRQGGEREQRREVNREREERHEPRRERETDRNREREVALRQLEQMRYALKAFRETEKGDAADLMHRAIRAAEIRLEGRNDRGSSMPSMPVSWRWKDGEMKKPSTSARRPPALSTLPYLPIVTR